MTLKLNSDWQSEIMREPPSDWSPQRSYSLNALLERFLVILFQRFECLPSCMYGRSCAKAKAKACKVNTDSLLAP
jgi:hypothetical protein